MATKVDIAEAQLDIAAVKDDVVAVEADLLRWMFGALIARGGLIVALVKLL